MNNIFKFLREHWMPLVLISVITFGLYAVNLQNQLFWDDDDWIVNNPFVHELNSTNLEALFTQNTLAGIGQKSNYYRPVLFLTFLGNYVIHGVEPLGYHLISNLIHIANALLIYILVFWLFRKKLFAFLTALFFAIHPLQTEAVTYISGRGDPLSIFFILCGILAFLWYRQKQKIAWLGASLVLQVLAILSREVAAITPAFILMIAMVLELRERGFLAAFRRGLFAALPAIMVSAIYTILRLTILNFKNTLDFYVADNIYSQHISYRIYTFMHALVDYVRLAFVPIGLHMERDVPIHFGLLSLPVIGGIAIVVVSIAILFLLYRNKNYRKKTFIVWFLGLGWFFAWLAPASGIIPVNARIYEHWLYFSLFGIGLIVAYYLDKLFSLKNISIRYGAIVVLILYAGFFGWMVIKRNLLWGSAEAFYKDILRYDPESVRIHNNLGNVYFNRGDVDLAVIEYEAAVKIEDIFPQPHFNLGSIFQERKEIAAAIAEYEKSISIDPDFPYGYQALGNLYLQQGQVAKAVPYYEKLKALRPDDPRVYYNLALLYLGQKKNDLAKSTALEGLQYADNDIAAKNALNELLTNVK